jgi:hypothetical protein
VIHKSAVPIDGLLCLLSACDKLQWRGDGTYCGSLDAVQYNVPTMKVEVDMIVKKSKMMLQLMELMKSRSDHEVEEVEIVSKGKKLSTKIYGGARKSEVAHTPYLRKVRSNRNNNT